MTTVTEVKESIQIRPQIGASDIAPFAMKSQVPATIAEAKADPKSKTEQRRSTLEVIDDRMLGASADELAKLVRARNSIILQDETLANGIEGRRTERMKFQTKVAFSVAAIAFGTGLLLAGFEYVGFFLIGASASVYVPDYVASFRSGKKDDGNG